MQAFTEEKRENRYKMEWTRSETLALAASHCTYCHGLGIRARRGTSTAPCNCVFRNIFRICLRRFEECADPDMALQSVTLEFTPGKDRRLSYARKSEEYVADFCCVSARNLTAAEHKLFRFHFILRADWKLCCKRLNIDRGTFFHAVYRIEQKLGRVFRELEPYALFPVDDYFSTVGRDVSPRQVQVKTFTPVRPNVPATKAA